MINYFSEISKGKIILWCYLIWYFVTVYFYFDPSIHIWLNSAGIGFVIGIALMLSVSKSGGYGIDYWQTFRLFMVPFCVSSFSALIKGKGFILVIPPKPLEQLVSVGTCLLFIVLVYWVKAFNKRKTD